MKNDDFYEAFTLGEQSRKRLVGKTSTASFFPSILPNLNWPFNEIKNELLARLLQSHVQFETLLPLP